MRYTLRLPDNEAAIIEEYCQSVNRTKTDVFREFVRSLATTQPTQSPDLHQLMLATGAREAQLVPVMPGIYELYLDGKYVCGGTYEEIARKMNQ